MMHGKGKTMKKIMAFILVLAMLSVGISISAVSAESGYGDDIKLLQDIGIVSEDFVDDRSITRAEFIGIIMNMIEERLSEKEYPNAPFSDITASADNYNAICAAYERGLVSGDVDGFFYPNRMVSYYEAVKILISALGYDKVADALGGYPAGYIRCAQDLRVIKGFTVADAEALKNGEAANLIKKALSVRVGEIAEIGTGGVKHISSDETFMWKEMRLAKTEGILQRNSYTSLLSTSDANLHEIQIGDLTGRFYHSTDEEKYLGYHVECYYKTDESDNVTILSIIPTNKNNVTVISAEQYDDFNDGNLYYWKSENSSRKHLSISPNTTVICNQNAKIDYTSADFDIEEGTITAIDNNSDGKIDVVLVTSYEDYAVEGISADKELITDYYGRTLSFKDVDKDRSILLNDINGQSLSFEDLKKQMVISAIISPDGKYVRGIVSEQKKAGALSAKKLDGNNTVLCIDNKNYEAAKSIPTNEIEKIELNTGITIAVDAFGKAAAIYTDSRLMDYAMLIASAYDDMREAVRVKLMNVSGAIKIYELAKNVRFNGVKLENKESFSSLVHINDIFLYKLNNTNEIVEVETTAGNILHSCGEKATKAYSGGMLSFSGQLPVQEKTPVFFYPAPEDGAFGDEDYFVLTREYFKVTSPEVQGFNTNEKSFAPEVLAAKNGKYLQSGRIHYNSSKVIFSDLLTGLNTKGEETYFLEIYSLDGTRKTLELKSIDVYNDLVSEAGELKCGDMIIYSQIDFGVVDCIDKFFDYETKSIPATSKFYPKSIVQSFRPNIGYIYEITDTMLIGFSADGRVAESASDVEYYCYTASTPVYSVHVGKNGNIVSKTISVDALNDLINDNVKSKVYYRTTDGRLAEIIVFEEDE